MDNLHITPFFPEEIERLRARIFELEDCLAELAPFAEAYEVRIDAQFRVRVTSDDPKEIEAEKKRIESAHYRDTLHMDQHVFRRIKRLLGTKTT